jgi:hypothetical protein
MPKASNELQSILSGAAVKREAENFFWKVNVKGKVVPAP